MAYNLALESDLRRSLIKQKQEPCVFISHKKEDESAAIAIGKFLMYTAGVNIYLDILDDKLQSATKTNDDKAIVQSIKTGLENSSHLLCLISDKTKLSWWVPYEIGIADQQTKNIASLKLNTTDDVPSFLKIHTTFYNIKEFIRYITPLKPYGRLLFESFYPDLLANAGSLKQYIDE